MHFFCLFATSFVRQEGSCPGNKEFPLHMDFSTCEGGILLKKYDQANVQILFDLFSWKKRAGEIVRFEITERDRYWVISFISYSMTSSYEHTFASFTGDSHDELYTWALTLLTDFTLRLDKNEASLLAPLAASTEASTQAFL